MTTNSAGHSKGKLEAPNLKKIIKFLKAHRIYYQRLNTTGIPRLINNKIVLVPNPLAGTADVVTLQPLATGGCRLVYLEAKREKGGVQNPKQKVFQQIVIKHGAEYYLVNDPDSQLPEIYTNERK